MHYRCITVFFLSASVTRSAAGIGRVTSALVFLCKTAQRECLRRVWYSIWNRRHAQRKRCQDMSSSAYEIKIKKNRASFSPLKHTLISLHSFSITRSPHAHAHLGPEGRGLGQRALWLAEISDSLAFICVKLSMASSRTMVYKSFSLQKWHLLISWLK